MRYLTNVIGVRSLIPIAVFGVGCILIFMKSDAGYLTQSLLAKITSAAVAFKVEDLGYNLLGVIPPEYEIPEEFCNLENMNAFRLQQDHPCVIQIIRRYYMRLPSAPSTPLNLDRPAVKNPSAAQSDVILSLLKNQTGGFFVECGAADGELGSNTLYMERSLNWTGILIEAERKFYSKLITKERKAHALPVCLSMEPYPTEVTFIENGVAGKISDDKQANVQSNKFVKVQCFPFYSILLAVGRTQVDYFSVDVEGSETAILKTIPWHRVDIKSLTVEVTSRNSSIVDALAKYMESNGYIKDRLMDGSSYFDLVFIKKSTN